MCRRPSWILSGCGRPWQREDGSFKVLVVPGQVAFQPIAYVTWYGDPVKLSRVDNELCLYAEAFKRLIHLLDAYSGNVEILLPGKKEGWGSDPIRLEERVRELDPEIFGFPWR